MIILAVAFVQHFSTSVSRKLI